MLWTPVTARPAGGGPRVDGASIPDNDRNAVVQREKEQFGGIKWGSAFFGWLTATGTAVLLTARSTNDLRRERARQATQVKLPSRSAE